MQAAAAVMVAAVLFKQHIELYIFGFVYLQELDIVPVYSAVCFDLDIEIPPKIDFGYFRGLL